MKIRSEFKNKYPFASELLERRFGIYDGKIWRFKELADLHGVTRGQAQALYETYLEKFLRLDAIIIENNADRSLIGFDGFYLMRTDVV